MTRDCPPRSGAAIFSPSWPQARNVPGSDETQPSRLPTRPGRPPSPASARLQRGCGCAQPLLLGGRVVSGARA